MSKLFKCKYIYIYISLIIFFMFLAMSLVTPLQGDDWGYALNGQNNNPFYMAYQFYLSWSGRYFSEL